MSYRNFNLKGKKSLKKFNVQSQGVKCIDIFKRAGVTPVKLACLKRMKNYLDLPSIFGNVFQDNLRVKIVEMFGLSLRPLLFATLETVWLVEVPLLSALLALHCIMALSMCWARKAGQPVHSQRSQVIIV